MEREPCGKEDLGKRDKASGTLRGAVSDTCAHKGTRSCLVAKEEKSEHMGVIKDRARNISENERTFAPPRPSGYLRMCLETQTDVRKVHWTNLVDQI